MPKMNINEVKNIINSRLSDARDDKKNVVDRLTAMAEAYAYWFILDKANAVNQNVELENNNEVPEQTLSNGYTLTHTYFNSGFSPSASPLSRNL